MMTNGNKLASPKTPLVTTEATFLKRKRFRRIKSAPSADSFTYIDKHTNGHKPRRRRISISDYLHPTYWKVAVTLFAYLAAGTLCFHLTRHQISGTKTNSVLDALYFTVVTMSSAGYEDLVPASTLTVLLSYLFVLSGMLIVGYVLSEAAEHLVEEQERLLAKALHKNKTSSEVEIGGKIRTKRVRRKCIIKVVFLLVLVMSGTSLLHWVEDLDSLHAFYCVFGALTGNGYTDKCFSTKGGRVFALVWIVSSTVFLGQLLFSFVSLYTEKKKRSLVKSVLRRKTTVSDIEAADFDGDGIVVAAEFIVYKLKEMGKITEDDVTPIMDEFETLDFHKTGTLSAAGLLLSQSSVPIPELIPPRLSV